MSKQDSSVIKYINPFTDFGFKIIFGSEPNKDILIEFLNEILKQFDVQIKDLTYKNVEQQGINSEDRKIIFDLHCIDENGDYFTVELQKAKQIHFKDRLVYYGSRTIQEQGVRGNWDYNLKAVYIVGIMDFVLEEEKRVLISAQLLDLETKKIYYNKLSFTNLYVRNFDKSENELETNFDKWVFLLKNLHQLKSIPMKLQNNIFQKVFNISEYTSMSREAQNAYDESLKNYNDLQNSLNTAEKDGYENAEKIYLPLLEKERKEKEKERKEKLEAKRKEEIAKKREEEAKKRENQATKREEEANQNLIKMIQTMLGSGFSMDKIAELLGKSVEEIQSLIK